MTSLEIKNLCNNIVISRSKDDIMKLSSVVCEKSKEITSPFIQRDLLATCFLLLKGDPGNGKSNLNNDDKIIVIGILKRVLSNTKIEQEIVYFNLLSLLLAEIYNVETHNMKNLSEEHTLVVVSCMKALFNSSGLDVVLKLYDKKNGTKFSRAIYALLQIVKIEKYRVLRLVGIECLMALFKVNSDDHYSDFILRSQISQSFSYFLPGIATGLTEAATVNYDKIGSKMIQTAVKGFARIISLLMQNYSDQDDGASLDIAKRNLVAALNRSKTDKPEEKNEGLLENYMNSGKDSDWFKKADKFLSKLIMKFPKLTQHSALKVKVELCEMCKLFVQNCSGTMSISLRYIVVVLIILTEDEDSQILNNSREILKSAMEICEKNQLLENSIHEGFHEAVAEIPKIFNGIDDDEKIAVLKLVSGYVEIFGENLKLNEHYTDFFHNLFHLCEFEYEISTFHENIIEDLNDEFSKDELWKNLKFLENDRVRLQFRSLCRSLVKNDNFESFLSFLTTIFVKNFEMERKNATYFLNELISGLGDFKGKVEMIEPIFHLYTEEINWNLPLEMSSESEMSLRNIRNNIQQVALLVEGLGIISEILQEDYRKFLMKSLFFVLSRAGSKQPLIRSSGKRALQKISQALNYDNPTELLNENMDYIVFYIERNLKNNPKIFVFDVLEIVITYGDKNTLDNLISVIEEILVQSCDKFKDDFVNFYLKIFKVFLGNLRKWFADSSDSEEIFLSRAEKKEAANVEIKINGLDEEITDFSDEIMGKTAEEMYKEDMERKQREDENPEDEIPEFKKEVPPNFIKLSVEILKRCLNFLPSKEKLKKLLVLEILNEGIFLIKDYEDELLPVVHLIWSPLVGRFSDKSEPVLINYSFQLLCNLARFSKEFIRSRTVKEILPKILNVLSEISEESLLKDRGSAYRYSQTFKLQLNILEKLPCLINNLDLPNEEIEKIMNVVLVYLSCKQPVPLQKLVVNFMQRMIAFDEGLKETFNTLKIQHESDPEYSCNLSKIEDSD